MHVYISHLLQEIASAHQKDTQEVNNPEQALEAYFAALKQWSSGQPSGKTLGYFCDLDSGNFPPAEQLTVKEMILVLKAFNKMLLTWNHQIHLPKELPIVLAYQLSINCLNRDTVLLDAGCINFDFCTGSMEDCELKEYCSCLKLLNEEECDKEDEYFDFNFNQDELPF